MNGIDAMNPPLDREAVDAARPKEREPSKRPTENRPATDDSSPDPFSHTDRYRLSMPYTERI